MTFYLNLRPREIRWVVRPSVVQCRWSGSAAMEWSRWAGNIESIDLLREIAGYVWQLMGVSEIVNVSAGVVHVVRPKLWFTVGWRYGNGFARVLVDRMVPLDFKCNATCLLRLFGLKTRPGLVRDSILVWSLHTSSDLNRSGLFRDDRLGCKLWSQHDGTNSPSSTDSSSDSTTSCGSSKNKKKSYTTRILKQSQVYLPPWKIGVAGIVSFCRVFHFM